MTEKDKLNTGKQQGYVEVIGDTVLGKHLITAIVISVFLSLGFFYLGKFIFPKIAPDNMVQSYSLLLGIAGSLIGLIVNALLFKPKRKLLESAGSGEELRVIYNNLQLDLESERENIANDPVIIEEMKAQGIYDMFFSGEGDDKK